MNLTKASEGRGRLPKGILILLIISLVFSFFLGLDFFALGRSKDIYFASSFTTSVTIFSDLLQQYIN
jgi:hypothetical protein